MARHEADREDLMGEATALRERVELGGVVAGFHGDGRLSVYFGGDPAYHFDRSGGLRRAFAGGLLYRTQGETLARLRRVRGATESVLERHDLNAAELEQFLGEMRERIRKLAAGVDDGSAGVIRQVPEEAPIVARLRKALEGILSAERALGKGIKK